MKIVVLETHLQIQQAQANDLDITGVICYHGYCFRRVIWKTEELPAFRRDKMEEGRLVSFPSQQMRKGI